MGDRCMLAEYQQCCCTCRYHEPDYHHCTTVSPEFRAQHEGCVCSIQKGWVCRPPEWEGVHSNWSEHGLCEMHMPKRPAEAD